ncbi:MAG: tetratricopeptide repeat protein [Pseudomonadota bacterium]
MSDFLREVDEDYRRDQLLALWKRYGLWLASVAAVAVLAVGAGVWWRDYQAGRRQAVAERYEAALTALDAGQVEQGLSTLAQVSEEGIPGYRVLGLLARARALLSQGRRDEAVASYEALAASEDVPALYSSLGTLLAAQARLDELSAAEVEARLAPLGAVGAPWAASANELIATAFLKEGHNDKARELFGLIAVDPTAPAGVRGRAANIGSMLGPAPATPPPHDEAGMTPAEGLPR